MAEASSNEVLMDTFTSDTVDIILKYIYTGVLTSLEECDMASIVELMDAAGLYNLEPIKITCYKYLVKHFISVDNVGEIILLGRRHGFDNALVEPAKSFLKRNFDSVKKTDEFMKLLKDHEVFAEFFLN